MSVVWISVAAKGLWATDPAVWAKNEFHFALIFLVVFCVVISINPYVP
jgi:heme O synthase-like polyprenyltransferase